MKTVWHVYEHEEYGGGHFTLAICSTQEKALRVRDWYRRDGIYVCKENVDLHKALLDRRKEERRKG